MTRLDELDSVVLSFQARHAYLHDAQFHREVDVAANIWWLGMAATPTMKEYRNLGAEAICVALWYQRLKAEQQAHDDDC